MMISLAVSIQYTSVTDTQTDRQTDRQTPDDGLYRTMHSIAYECLYVPVNYTASYPTCECDITHSESA